MSQFLLTRAEVAADPRTASPATSVPTPAWPHDHDPPPTATSRTTATRPAEPAGPGDRERTGQPRADPGGDSGGQRSVPPGGLFYRPAGRALQRRGRGLGSRVRADRGGRAGPVVRARRHLAQGAADGCHGDLGTAAGRLHRVAEPRAGRGPAVRGRCWTRHRGGGRRTRCARCSCSRRRSSGWSRCRCRPGCSSGRRPRLDGVGRRRAGAVAMRAGLRVGRRLAAGPVQGRPGPPGHGHGPGLCAVHPAPELLRGRCVWWGLFLLSLGRIGVAAIHADPDELPAGPRERQADHGRRLEVAARVRGLRGRTSGFFRGHRAAGPPHRPAEATGRRAGPGAAGRGGGHTRRLAVVLRGTRSLVTRPLSSRAKNASVLPARSGRVASVGSGRAAAARRRRDGLDLRRRVHRLGAEDAQAVHEDVLARRVGREASPYGATL